MSSAQRIWVKGPKIAIRRIVGAHRNDKGRVVQWSALRSDGVLVVCSLGRTMVNSRGMGFVYPERYFAEMLLCNCPAGNPCSIHPTGDCK